MITIIRYRNDTYFGLEGKFKYPTTMHSGFIDEEREIMKNYRKRLEEFEKNKKGATFLNKVHAKKALDTEIPDWQEIFKQELKSIEDYLTFGSSLNELYKKEYTFYYINNATIEDLTKPTN